jgi:hypothetical protein
MILAHARCMLGAKPPPPQPAAFPGVNLKHAEAEVNARLKEALEFTQGKRCRTGRPAPPESERKLGV